MQKLFSQQHPFVNNTQERGIITMMGVLIVGAVGIAISVSSLLLAIGATRTSMTEIESAQARALANACMERALNALRENPSYTGNDSLSLGSGTCQILPVVNPGSSTPTIKTTGIVRDVTRKVQVVIGAMQPRIQISSWKEIADF